MTLNWSPDAIFTPAHARFLGDRGLRPESCVGYIGATIVAWASLEPDDAIHFAPDVVPDAILHAYAIHRPGLTMKSAADRLPADVLDACAARAPGFALKYAVDKLTAERLDACAAAEPGYAIFYAEDRLTPNRLAWCLAQMPEVLTGRAPRFPPGAAVAWALVMTMAAVAVIALLWLLSSPADAAEASRSWPGAGQESHVTLHAPTAPDAVASVTFHNEEVHSADETFALTWQGIAVTVEFDWNHNDIAAERITVYPPQGYIAVPPRLTVDEGEAQTLHIMKWEGM